MSSPSARSRWPAILAAALLVSAAGCVDYTNRLDAVNIHAGDAQAANTAIQTIDPWPLESERTFVDANGKKVKNAIDAYTSPKKSGSGGTTNITVNN